MFVYLSVCDGCWGVVWYGYGVDDGVRRAESPERFFRCIVSYYGVIREASGMRNRACVRQITVAITMVRRLPECSVGVDHFNFSTRALASYIYNGIRH